MAVEEKALVKVADLERTPARDMSFTETMTLGKVLFESGYFSDVKSAAQAVVKILRGRELGIGPVAALEQIHVIQGKTGLGAGLIGALIKRSGRYDYRVVRNDDAACEIVFLERGKEIGRSTFTMEDAKRAGLGSREMWQKYPRNMLYARALSNGARWYCPDVFGGAIYTPEELTQGEVAEAEIVVATEQNACEPETVSQPEYTPESTARKDSAPRASAKQANGKDKVKQAWCERIYTDAHKRNIDDNMVKLIAGVEILGREDAVESLYELTAEQLQKLHERVKTKGQVA